MILTLGTMMIVKMIPLAYLLDSGFGPLGTSCAAALNCWCEAEPEVVGMVVVVVLVIAVVTAAVLVVEGGIYFVCCGCDSGVDCFVLVDGGEVMDLLEKSIGSARRGTINRSPRNSNIACDFVLEASQTDDLLTTGAMKLSESVIINHRPVIQQGSISMNHLKHQILQEEMEKKIKERT